MLKICLVSFSGRSDGNCSNIVKELRKCLEDNGEITVFDFSAIEITQCGRCNCECFQRRESCPYFSDPEYSICESITNSDYTYFIIPNYCDYPCANFFIFNERSQCYFQHHHNLLEQYLSVRKKFIIVSNTGRENFMSAIRYHIAEDSKPDILFLSAKKFNRTSIKGDLMECEEARAAVRAFIEV